jgi:hypothetical protein
MIMTNFGLFHDACRGLHAPRDKYIFDRAAAEGHLKVKILDTMLPEYSFDPFPIGQEPTDSNLEWVIRSLKFQGREKAHHAFSMVDIEARLKAKIDIKNITEALVLKGLNKTYDDVCRRKGSIHYEAVYIAGLIRESARVTKYFNEGGDTFVY